MLALPRRAYPRAASHCSCVGSFLDQRVVTFSKTVKRQRDRNRSSRRVGERQFPSRACRTQLGQAVRANGKFSETTVRHASRKGAFYTGVTIASLNFDLGPECDVDGNLDHQRARHAFHGLWDDNSRERLRLALHLQLRELRHLAELARRGTGLRLALNDPVIVRGGRTLWRAARTRLGCGTCDTCGWAEGTALTAGVVTVGAA